MKKLSFLTKHLHSADETYFVHMRNALFYCVHCFKASIAIFIHSIIPFLFTTTGSSTIRKLYNIMSVRAQVTAIAANKLRHVAIVGFGASGVLTFYNIVKNHKKSNKKLVIRIFEKTGIPAKGIAYSTKNINHLLNVRVSGMKIDKDDPEHFYKWLVSNGYNYSKDDFVPRKIFGDYLEDLLKEAIKIANEKKISYEFYNDEIAEISIKNNLFLINKKPYSDCILAIGATLRNQQDSFWNTDLTKYLKKKEIHIAGSGLTAIDAVMSLRNLNYQGNIILHSRAGKIPQEHSIIKGKYESPLSLKDVDLPLSQIFRKFVKSCKDSSNWRGNFDAFRPLTQNFWQNLDINKKKQFMRHCFKTWNIYRHRCPNSQAAIINQMISSGKLSISKNRISLDKALNCSGFNYGFKSQLINSLIKNNIVELDDLKLGIISKNSNFYIVGAMNFGSMLEITAIPDIAPQSYQVAKLLTDNIHKKYSV